MNVDKLLNKQRFFRRLVLVWSIVIISYTVWFVLDKPFLQSVGTAGASIVLGIIGIFATVISFYQWHRQLDDKLRDNHADKS